MVENMEVDFELSQNLLGHQKEVRCVGVLNENRIATGDKNNTVILWQRNGESGQFELFKKLTHHTGHIYAMYYWFSRWVRFPCICACAPVGRRAHGVDAPLWERVRYVGKSVSDLRAAFGSVSQEEKEKKKGRRHSRIAERSCRLVGGYHSEGCWRPPGNLQAGEQMPGVAAMVICAGSHGAGFKPFVSSVSSEYGLYDIEKYDIVTYGRGGGVRMASSLWAAEVPQAAWPGRRGENGAGRSAQGAKDKLNAAKQHDMPWPDGLALLVRLFGGLPSPAAMRKLEFRLRGAKSCPLQKSHASVLAVASLHAECRKKSISSAGRRGIEDPRPCHWLRRGCREAGYRRGEFVRLFAARRNCETQVAF
eukprot:gene985-337_t